MRKINRIIIHCSATPEGRANTVEDIRRWHVDERGYIDIGYHYVIELDGAIKEGRKLELAGAHCKGFNRHSIGICYVGGMTKDMTRAKDTRTEAQKVSLRNLLKSIKKLYPDAQICGHHDLNPAKACPSFDATEEYKDL